MRRLRELRAERGLLQADVARQLNIAPATPARYESGDREPGLRTLLELADFYGATTDYLLGRSDDPTRPEPPLESEMAFGASLENGMRYEDLNPEGRVELYEYYQYLRQKYPKDEREFSDKQEH